MHRYVRSFSSADEVIELETIRSELITLGGLTVSHDVQQPGWRWSTHVQPLVGTSSCQLRHVGVVVRGRLHVVLDEGTEFEAGALDLVDIPAGHDAWVVGDEPVESISWTGVKGFLGQMETLGDRVLATILFTDIVDSTGTALRLGDRLWADLLTAYESRTSDVLAQYRGREVKRTGDGVLAVFDGAARALRCGVALRSVATDLRLVVRVAIHTGEVEAGDTDVRGVAVHETARMLGLAQPGEILVSATTAALSTEAGLTLDDRGDHELRGITGTRRLYAIR